MPPEPAEHAESAERAERTERAESAASARSQGRAAGIGRRLQAFGPPAEVLSGELIERLYHVPADVRHDPDGQPYVRTLRTAAVPG